jgi:hypothetical protein
MAVGYQVWLTDAAYARVALLANTGTLRTWQRLTYRQALNDVGSCTIEFVPTAAAISKLALAKRLVIYRGGVVVYGGEIMSIGWSLSDTSPSADTYKVVAMDHAAYAQWRPIVPAAGQEYDSRTDHVDDALRAYVYYHLGAGAATARVWPGITVEADAHAIASDTIQARYPYLLGLLQARAEAVGARFRFVPTATGAVFTLTAGRWGTDRRRGAAGECVWSTDRHNVLGITYYADTLSHVNYVYVAGQGEGADRTVVERSTAAMITAYGRREAFVDARDLSLTASLQSRGDTALTAAVPVMTMSAIPMPWTWRGGGTTGSWDLGDYVTIAANRYGTTETQNVEIVAVDVTISADGIERATPLTRIVA